MAGSDAEKLPAAIPCNKAVFKATGSLSLSAFRSHETDIYDLSSASDIPETVSASCSETFPASSSKVGSLTSSASNDRYFLSGRVFNHRISSSGLSFASRSSHSLLACSGCSGFSSHRSKVLPCPVRRADTSVCEELVSCLSPADCPSVFPAAFPPVPSSESCSSI